jgi:hypothetical protein
MDFLRPEFEEGITPTIKDGVISIGSLPPYKGVDILNFAGPEAYKQVFQEWLREEWLPSRRDRRDELLKFHANETHYADLGQIIASGGAIPFVGSGMSVPTGMPTWAGFLRAVRPKAPTVTAEALEACLGQGQYEEAASLICGGMPHQLFKACFDEHFYAPEPTDIDGAVRLLPRLFTSTIVTTNFDAILESVYASNGAPFHKVLFASQVDNFRRECLNGGRSLLKIHGHHDSKAGRVLLRDEYERFYAADSSGRRELTLLFQRGGLVFLGCSLEQDRTMALLKELADADANMPRHYAFLKAPDPATLTTREHFLAERNIFPIWYDGDHNTDIEALLVGLMDDLKRL